MMNAHSFLLMVMMNAHSFLLMVMMNAHSFLLMVMMNAHSFLLMVMMNAHSFMNHAHSFLCIHSSAFIPLRPIPIPLRLSIPASVRA